MAEGLLDQYREKLKKAIGTARFYGLPDRPLEKAFVELTVIEDFEIPRDAEYKALMDKELRRRRTLFPKDETEEDNPEKTDEEGRKGPRKVRRSVKPEELLEAGKRSQVVGAPGCGKTTLLRWLALQTANTNDRLPVFIELKALKKAQFDVIDDDFAKFLFAVGVKRRFDSTDLDKEQLTTLKTAFRNYYKAGRLVVLLDGLDEIAENERHRLRTAAENYANQREGGLTLIVSTRPYGYLRSFADLKAMEISPLSDRQIEQFLDHWCDQPTAAAVKQSLRKNRNLKSLARFPFLLAFISRMKLGGDIPRIDLYRQIVDELIVALDKDKNVERFKVDDPFGSIKRDFLRRLAFERLFEKTGTELSQRLVFDREELLKAAKVFVREEGSTISPQFLAADVCATPLLREVEGGRYTFAHLTIQEFLAAEELSKHNNCHQLFLKAFFNRQLAEMEVLPMTIGLADDPNKFYDLNSELSESIDFIGLRLQARGLGYCTKNINLKKRRWLRKRLTDFGIRTTSTEDSFSESVIRAFSRSGENFHKYLVGGLVKSLQDKDPLARYHAVQTLGRLNLTQKTLSRHLLNCLNDDVSIVRREAIISLGKIENASPPIASEIVRSLDDRDFAIEKIQSIIKLIKPEKASLGIINNLLNILNNKNSPNRELVVFALGEIGLASRKVVLNLINTLKETGILGISVSHEAAIALGKLGVGTKEALSTLIEISGQKDEFKRKSAIITLGQIGYNSKDAAAFVTKILNNEDYIKLEAAAEALGLMGLNGRGAIPSLIKALESESVSIQLKAAISLQKLGSVQPDNLSIIIKILNSSESYLRQEAISALGKIGINNKKVENALFKALHDKDYFLRDLAVNSLGEIRSKSPIVLSKLLKILLEDESKLVIGTVAESLGKIRSKSQKVLFALIQTLNHDDSSVRETAAQALGQIGATLPEVVTALLKALDDESPFVRNYATKSLNQVGLTHSKSVKSHLVQLSSHKDPDVRERVVKILGNLSSVPQSYRAILLKCLQDQDMRVRQNAARTLGRLKQVSQNVITALVSSLLSGETLGIRQSAAEALERIGFDSPEFLAGLKLMLFDTDPELQKIALRSIGYPSTDPGLLDDLKKLTESENPEIREAAEDAYNKYRLKLEMLDRLPV